MPASNRTLLVTSIGLNILLILSFYVFGDATSYYLGTKGMEKEITPVIQIIASAPHPEPTLALSERGRGGEGCTMCGVAPRLCDKIGEDKLNQAISYGGSNDRLRRVLAKIKSGEPFTMGVIGGSVSLAHGIRWGEGDDEPREPWNRPQSMHRIIFEHLHYLSPLSAEDLVPFDPTVLKGSVGSTSGESVVFGESGKTSSRNALVNGAQGGTGSGYFAYCWGEHVPQDTDIFIVELSINDELLTKNIESYELLVRSLLELPHKPAVLYIDIFALMFDAMGLGGEMHKGINQYYDIPSISLRNPFLPQVIDNFKAVEKFFHRQDGKKGEMEGMDLRHISSYAHHMTGDLVNAYIDMQLCEMERRLPGKAGGKDVKIPKEAKAIEEQYPVADIPKMLINKQYKLDQVVPPLKPQCMTMKSKTKKLEPLKQEGWRTWSHGEKHYWISTDPGSTISFAFSTTLGEVQLHYLRSKIFGLGNVRCWVDDDEPASVYIQGYWDIIVNIAQSTTIKGLTPGAHVLNCQIQEETKDPGGKHEFRIISITSI